MFDDKQRRVDFLLGLYEMAEGNLFNFILDTDLASKLNMDQVTFQRVALYLKEEGFIKFRTFKSISLAHPGLKEAERIMEQTYTEKKNRVIKAIQDMGRMSDIIPIDSLRERVGMPDREVSRFCTGLSEEGLIWFEGGDILQIKDKFYRALEDPQKPPTQTGHFTFNVTNNYGTIQQGFSNVINQSLPDVLPKLTEFIESVRELDFGRRDKVLEDLEELKTLAQGNLNPGIWELIQAKFLSAEAGLKIAGVVYSSHPYWPAISEFFRQTFK